MTTTPVCPTERELQMFEYQEILLEQISRKFGLPQAEVGVMAAAFLEGLSKRELDEVRKGALRGFRQWAEEEGPAGWHS